MTQNGPLVVTSWKVAGVISAINAATIHINAIAMMNGAKRMTMKFVNFFMFKSFC